MESKTIKPFKKIKLNSKHINTINALRLVKKTPKMLKKKRKIK